MSFAVLFFSFFFASQCLAIEGGKQVSPRSPLASVSVSLGQISSGVLQRSFCSGTLVSPHALVTAAHCVYGKNPSEVVVQFGVDGLSTSILSPATQIVIPHEYQPYETQLPTARETHDIGIVFFAGELPAGFHPAIMVDQELNASDENQVYGVAGFGKPEAGSLHTCSTRLLQSSFSRSEFELQESPTCSLGGGDSGGSVYRIQNQSVYLFGIHNWGWHDSSGNPAYSVETKLSFYGPWIRTLPQF